MDEDKINQIARITESEEENKRNVESIAQMNEWSREPKRKTKNLEKEMVDIVKENKELKEEAIKSSNMIGVLKGREEILKNETNKLVDTNQEGGQTTT